MERSINNETRLAKMEQKIDNIVEDVKEISKDIKDHIRWEGKNTRNWTVNTLESGLKN